MAAPSKLDLFGVMHGTDKSSIYHNYLHFYESVLPKEIDDILEIGVKDGASLKMWIDYYPMANVFGMDINKMPFIEDAILIRNDATKKEVLKKTFSYVPSFDIIIDDGSHLCSHQRKSFDIYWNHLRPGGFYIIEDVHTSFLGEYADETPTTYQWAMRLPGALEWWRDPSNKSDSGTIVIPKPL